LRSGILIARSLLFNLALWLWTGLLVIVALPLLASPRDRMVALGRLWQQGVQGLLARLAGLTYEVRGRERVPDRPAVFAFKHQSAWETLVLNLLFADPAIVLKRELTRIPLFGWYLRHAGMIGIDRAGGARAVRTLIGDARAALGRGSSIVIFPEGTRAPVLEPAGREGVYRSEEANPLGVCTFCEVPGTEEPAMKASG